MENEEFALIEQNSPFYMMFSRISLLRLVKRREKAFI
jgi:hypothetical protein